MLPGVFGSLTKNLFKPSKEPLEFIRKRNPTIKTDSFNSTTGETLRLANCEKTSVTDGDFQLASRMLGDIESANMSQHSEEKVCEAAFRMMGMDYIADPEKREKLFLDSPDVYNKFLEKYWIADYVLNMRMGGLACNQIPPSVVVVKGEPKSKLAPVLYLGFGLGGLATVTGLLFGDIDGDGINTWDEITKHHTDPLKPNPAFKYALDKGMKDPEVLDSIKLLDKDVKLDVGEKEFLDIVSKLPENLQARYVSRALSDGKFDQRDMNNIQFLESLDKKEFDELVKSEQVSKYDLDDDKMDNYFEKFIAGLPYDVKNNRYVVFAYSGKDWDAMLPSYLFMINDQKIPRENVHLLTEKEVTASNIESAILDMVKKVGKNDIVYIEIDTHGALGIFGVYKENSTNKELDEVVTYEQLDKWVDKINAKEVVVMLGVCDSYTAREPMRDGPCPRIVAPGIYSDVWVRRNFAVWRELDKEKFNIPVEDDNGYISIGEAVKSEQMKLEPKNYFYFDISDPDGIAFKTYLGDFMMDERPT